MRRLLTLMSTALVLLALSATAAAAVDLKPTPNHDWTVEDRRPHNPPCGNPLPCVGDVKGATNAPDYLPPSNGWDWVQAFGGADVLYGGEAMDQIYGGFGADKIIGGPGHDHLFGQGGDDYIRAADGKQEAGNIEEVWGDLDGVGVGVDECIIDADPDGAVVRHCETLRIWATDGYSGQTKVFPSQQERKANVNGRLYSVGNHYNVNLY